MAIFDDEQIEGIREFFNDIIDSFGRPCRLLYQQKFSPGSPSLLLSDTTYLENVGVDGVPTGGQTYNEGAAGAVGSQESDIIYLVIDWTIKDNVAYPAQTELPYATIRVHGYIGDLPKIQKATEIEINLPTGAMGVGRYKISGDPVDIFNIVPGRYFIAYCARLS